MTESKQMVRYVWRRLGKRKRRVLTSQIIIAKLQKAMQISDFQIQCWHQSHKKIRKIWITSHQQITSIRFRCLVPSFSSSAWSCHLTRCFSAGSRCSGRSMPWGQVPLPCACPWSGTGGLSSLGAPWRLIPSTLWWSIGLNGVPTRLGLLVWWLFVSWRRPGHIPPTSFGWLGFRRRTAVDNERPVFGFGLDLILVRFLDGKITPLQEFQLRACLNKIYSGDQML